MATNLNVPTNGLSPIIDVFTMFLASHASLVMWIWDREKGKERMYGLL